MEAVGVRELRQNLSVYLRRVQRGEVFEVTDHGNPVAILSPRKGEDWFERLVAAGRVRVATKDIRDLPPPLKPRKGEKSWAEILDEQREDGA